ncbi:MAG: uL15m family ribosomal protein [Candidatus Woesearchaeota archaeon]
MVVNHRKKNSRHRGTWTHGHGEKKKHRGAGSRGGRGNAGSGKRGDAKKPSYWKLEDHEGKHGFTNPNKKICVAATINQLNININYLVEQGFAIKEDNVYSINLSALGVNKLIATGNPLFSFKIAVEKSTESAIKKIEEKGGSVTLGKVEN